MRVRTLWIPALALVLSIPGVASADVPLEMPLQGVLRDNAGNLTDGSYEVTFSLYDVAEDGDALWTETVQVTVTAGIFATRLGTDQALDPGVFAASAGLWLGMAVEDDPELPRRPLGTSGYAFQAATASDLACSGCVDAGHLSQDATDYIRSEALDAVSGAGYTTIAGGLFYDDSTSQMGTTNVQTAIEELKVLVDSKSEGGGANGNVNEGAGQVIAYETSGVISAKGGLKQYVHLVNPSTPKVVSYIYGESEGSNKTYKVLTDPENYFSELNMDTHSHGGGYSPKYEEFWYPNWSGSTIYRHSLDGNQIDTFNCGWNDIMQLWGDLSGDYYTANWGYNQVAKWMSMGDTKLWDYNIGSTAGGVCSDGTYIYAMRESGNTVWKLDKDNGSLVDTFGLPNVQNSLHGGLACVPGRLYYGSTNSTNIRVYELLGNTEVDNFTVCEGVYNMSFDGKTMWITDNDNTMCGYDLLDGNMYQGAKEDVEWVYVNDPEPAIRQGKSPKAVEIWVDGQNVTGLVGNPNGKVEPEFNTITGTWGTNGLDAWSSGILDLTGTTNWTLGEHVVELRETGGQGGELKLYVYVIYPFTESTPPANDSCSAPEALDLSAGEVVVSGTTEDTMGKTLATDAEQMPGCGGLGGPDVVYQIDVAERSLINGSVTAPYATKLYLRSGDCASGDLVYCAESELQTNPVEPGSYFLVVDSDSSIAKGNFTVTASLTPAPLPDHDTCDSPTELIFSAGGEATASSTNIYSLDQYKGLCAAALDGGPDVVYMFEAGTGQILNVSITADFEPILYVKTSACDDGGIPLACSATGTLTIQGLAGGTYWLVVDGKAEKQWGDFDLTVTLQ